MYTTVTSTNKTFVNLCKVDKFKTLVCPTSANSCTAINVFLGKHFTERQNITMGIFPQRCCYTIHQKSYIYFVKNKTIEFLFYNYVS